MASSDRTTVRFSVVSFAPRQARLAVIGSCQELGQWKMDQVKVMQCRIGDKRLGSEPDMHYVDLPVPTGIRHEYKFVEMCDGAVRWEELGAGGNRQLEVGDTLNDEFVDGVYLLPVERFAEPGGAESDHTSRFYQGVKDRGEISIRRVTSQVLVGSCPRHVRHIDELKSQGVTVVVNFQTEEDCKKNCVSGIGMEEDPMAVMQFYQDRGMEYIWMPTFDMSTDGRAQMLPQASHLFCELTRRGHVVYSHCNAGVGRSVAAVCGYLSFALGLPFRPMQHIVAGARPVAFFDFEALGRAQPRYKAMFGGPSGETERDDACRKEALATLDIKS